MDTFITPKNPDEFLPSLRAYIKDKFHWVRDEGGLKTVRDEITTCLRQGVRDYGFGVDDNFWSIELSASNLVTGPMEAKITPLGLVGVAHNVLAYAPAEGEKDDGKGGFVATALVKGQSARAASGLEATVALAKMLRGGVSDG